MRKVFVGVDVSKDKLDISLTVDAQKYQSFDIFNNETSILGFFDYLKNTYKKSTFYIGYEATSNYMHVLQKLCTEHNINQIMINPYMMSQELQIAMKEGHEQHKLIAKIDGKLDLLISQITQK